MMRVSTTVLESFRLFMIPDQTWMPEAELLDTIRGAFTPTPKMLLGQAFGRCLEKPDKYRKEDSQGEYYAVPVKTADGTWKEIVFPGDTMRPCLEKFDRRGVFEVRAVKEYGDVSVVAKVDQLLGMRIKENKSKLGQFDIERYHDSCQWRFYLDAFGAAALDYLVFVLDEDSDVNEDGHGAIELKDVHEFSFYPYAGMHDDCAALVSEFVDYVTARGLDGYLREQHRRWA